MSTWVSDAVEWCARTERYVRADWLISSTYRQAAPFPHCKYSTSRYNPQFSSRTKPYSALSMPRPHLLCWHSICFRYPPSIIVTLFGNYVKYKGLSPKYFVLSVKAHFTLLNALLSFQLSDRIAKCVYIMSFSCSLSVMSQYILWSGARTKQNLVGLFLLDNISD